jgi:hypothetical protein
MLKNSWRDTLDELLELLILIGGQLGVFMVWMCMLATSIILWYFVFAMVF